MRSVARHPRRPRKRFGQHFLEPAWVRKVVDAIDPRPEEIFIEIGPGGGALTRPLAERAATVVAIEVDRDLAAALRAARVPNVTTVEADVLDVDLPALVREHGGGRPVRIAGNLPYNIASPILFRLIDAFRAGAPLGDATLMLQLEVADRLAAAPDTREYGVLAILASLYADVERVLTLPPGAFRPPPAVRSAVVRLRFRRSAVPVEDARLLESLVKTIFTQRRKMLANALKPFAAARGLDAAAALAAAGLDGGRRPETLQLPELARLAAVFASGRGRA
jgi:16S rRNA (adenine1518-N6/adenine1519-N6)-dimethyltransferase